MCLWETHMWPNCVTNTLVSALICSQVLNFRLVFVQITKHHWFYEYLVASVWTFKFCIEFNFAMEICQHLFQKEASNPISLFNITRELVPIKIKSLFFLLLRKGKLSGWVPMWTQLRYWHLNLGGYQYLVTYCNTVGYHQYLVTYVTYCTQY